MKNPVLCVVLLQLSACVQLGSVSLNNKVDAGVRADAGVSADAGVGVDAGTGQIADAGQDVCGNGLDDNNNGMIDEGCACQKNQTANCWTGAASQRGVGACKDGVMTCTGTGEFSDWSGCSNVHLPSIEVEGNCIDEDCDGKAPGCPMSCQSEFGEVCDDGVDNDCNTLVDCADPACLGNAKCSTCENSQPEVDALCSDGIDNDCNGKIDCSEPACAGNCASCQQVSPSESNCADHVDDDCDGKIDCADPDCRYPGVCGCALHETKCHDGFDEDCDGATDCKDVDCEKCSPGAKRWCDEPNFCHFGEQECAADGTWGRCHEVAPPSQCKSGGVFGGIFGTDYDQDCCVAAGLCCQNYHSGGGSIGNCGSAVSCKP